MFCYHVNTQECLLDTEHGLFRRILGSIYTRPVSFTCTNKLANQQWTSFLCIFLGISTHLQCLGILTGHTLHLVQNRLWMMNNFMRKPGHFLCYTVFSQWKTRFPLIVRHSLSEQTMLLYFPSTIFASDPFSECYLFSIQPALLSSRVRWRVNGIAK